MTRVGRADEPVDGEIAVTVGAAGGIGVGRDGDWPSQAANPIANVNSNIPRQAIFLIVCTPY
jgi:hypothetical protein